MTEEDQNPQAEEDFFKSFTPPRPGAPPILPTGSPPPANPEEEKFFQDNFQQYSDELTRKARAGYENDPWMQSLQKNLPWTEPFIEGIQGIGSGPAKTVRGASQIAHKYIPAIPELPEKYATPPTVTGWGEITQPVEQGAEFLAPAKRVTQIGKLIDTAKAPWLVRTAGKAALEAVPAAGITYVQSGGDPNAARASALGTAATTALLPVIGRILAEGTGMSTGVGGYAVERAATNPTPELMAAMRGDITEAQVLGATRDAASYVKAKRSADYLHLRNQLPNVQLNLNPIKSETLRALKDFDIVPTLNPQTGGLVLDFSHSPINIKAAQDQIQSVVDDLARWQRTDTLGMDNLKRRMDNLIFDNSDAHAFVTRIKGSVRDQLNTVPGYKAMTRNYAEMSDFVDNLTELSLNARNDGTAIRKLAGSLKQNNEYRRLLLEALDGYTNKDLVGMIAGTRLSPMMPRGIVGALHAASLGAGVGSSAAILHDPKVLLGLFGMSPRAVGELAAKARLAARFGKAAAAQQAPGFIHVTGQQPESYDKPQYAKGGPIRFDDGGDVDTGDDDYLNNLQNRRLGTFRLNLGLNQNQPLELRQGPRPSNAPQMLAPSREQPDWMPAPSGRSGLGSDDTGIDTGLSSTMSQKMQFRPEVEAARTAYEKANEPFAMPTTGGSPMELSDIIPKPPESGLEAALLAATVIPPGKILKGAKGAVEAGTRMMEGAAPEAGLLSRAITATENTPQLYRSADITGARLGSGTWAQGEAAVTDRANQIRDLLAQMRQEKLTPKEMEAFGQAQQISPEIREIAPYMMPLEASRLVSRPENIEAMNRLLRVLPTAEKMAATATAGAPKLGWYRGSSQALMDVFGSDAPRVAQLMAATSPQTSVESNLINTLNIWRNWTAQGRPRDRESILKIMGQSVQGNKGEQSILPAWKDNAVAALSAENPMELTISGPKVDSFAHNLRDDVFRVANDAWMANSFGVAQDLFKGQGVNVAKGNPGIGLGYAATSARLRHGAALAGMYPSQGQEAIWSVALKLYEQARKYNIDPREVLDRGLLTSEVVRGTPDFSTLLTQGKYADILRRSGKEEQLAKLQQNPFQFQVQRADLTPSQQNLLHETAGTIGDLMQMRDRETRAKLFEVPKAWTGEAVQYQKPKEENMSRFTGHLRALDQMREAQMNALYPERALGVTNLEEMPGASTGHLPALLKDPRGTREYVTSALHIPKTDYQGRDIMQTASGLATVPTRNVQGAYVNSKGQVESQPGRALPHEVKLGWQPPVGTPEQPVPFVGTWEPTIDPQTRADWEGAMAAHGMIGAQEGVGGNILVPSVPPLKGESADIRNLRIPLEAETTERRIRQAAKKYPQYAFASSGPDIHVLGLDNVISRAEADDMVKIFKGEKYIPAENVGAYVNFANEWANKPGSGEVTKKFFQYADQMSPDAYARLNQDIREVAGDTMEKYSYYNAKKKTPVRKDLMNLLDTVQKSGLDGLRAALRSGAFLPGVAGAFLLPSLMKNESRAAD